jgi:hypothetical protein
MRWAKRLAACKYADIGKTKLDELIGKGLIRAKKVPGSSPNTSVYVDLDSVDQYFDSLPDAPLQKSEPATAA